MQVSNATRPDVPAHLAIAQALHHTEDVTRTHDSTPTSAKALLTPFLAYNLGLEYHAAPFYAASGQQNGGPGHTTQSPGVTAGQPACGSVRLSKWQGSSRKVPSPATPPVADAVWVSSVRQPDASLLQSQHGTEHSMAEAAAQDHPSSSGTQQQKHGKAQVDDGFDSALVAALQSYFKQHPRCAMAPPQLCAELVCACTAAKVAVVGSASKRAAALQVAGTGRCVCSQHG